MKKIIALICIITMMISGAVLPANVQASNDNLFELSAQSNLSNITLTWEKQEGVSYYKVYRLNYSKYINNCLPLLEKNYEEIAQLTNDKTEYVDNKVKKGIKYSYFVKGFKEKEGKDKLICSTYKGWERLVVTKGLATPEIRGAGYSKKNNRFKLLIGYEISERQISMQPTGYDIYRKEVGKKQYKKIKLEKIGKTKFADEKAKRGKVYKYKVMAYIIIGEKKYYSKRSNILKIDTTNYVGKYSVKLLTKQETDTSTLTFKVKSKNKYNSNTYFYPGGAIYFHRNTKEEKQGRYSVKFTQYSLDNKTWKKIPKKGALLKAKKTIYLKCDVYDDESKERATISFGKSKPYESYIFFGESEFGNAIDYKNSELYAEATFDFVTRNGRAHQEGD